MEINAIKIKNCIYTDDEHELIRLLNFGLDPNFDGGWPIRLAARCGFYSIVNVLLRYGANPHLLGESGASTLQLAVYSGAHWDTDGWTFLLSCCDSSQLADGAAVAVIFKNEAAFKKILETGRCNLNIPTTLTGKTLENLAKGFKMYHLVSTTSNENNHNSNVRHLSPRFIGQIVSSDARNTVSPNSIHRNLSPSVARFFHQTANQMSLSPQRSPIMIVISPTTRLN